MPRERKPIDHGTVAGAQAHRRRGEKPCERCNSAWNTYYKDRRRGIAGEKRRDAEVAAAKAEAQREAKRKRDRAYRERKRQAAEASA